jgi:hypothetical protein
MKRVIIILVLVILVDISHFLHLIPDLGKTKSNSFQVFRPYSSIYDDSAAQDTRA